MLSRGRALSGRSTLKLPNIFAKNAVAVRYASGAIIFEIGQPPDLTMPNHRWLNLSWPTSTRCGQYLNGIAPNQGRQLDVIGKAK
ncbi:MAG: hypothetical protein QOG92_2455, partial [Verrucomicrobiota bacterium]|nr:hypothetical protein [Verrucomicrobiota bacterium]